MVQRHQRKMWQSRLPLASNPLYQPMVKRTFDLIASFYPLLEQIVFGSTLSLARRFFTNRVIEGDKVLLVGEGNGRFLFEIVKQASSGSFTVVDSSARMLT